MNSVNEKIRNNYTEIYNWHINHGLIRIEEKYTREDAYKRAYLELLKVLPSPEIATQSDMDFIFKQVIMMLLEWSYHEYANNGIKLSDLAKDSLSLKYERLWNDPLFKSSLENSELEKNFSLEVWKEKYK